MHRDPLERRFEAALIVERRLLDLRLPPEFTSRAIEVARAYILRYPGVSWPTWDGSGVSITAYARDAAATVSVAWWDSASRAVVQPLLSTTCRCLRLNVDEARVLADPLRYLAEVAEPRWRASCEEYGVELPRPKEGEIVQPAHTLAVLGDVHIVRWLHLAYAVLPGAGVCIPVGDRTPDEAAAIARAARDAGQDAAAVVEILGGINA